MKLSAFDLETSGRLPEYALQPWRVKRGDAWITSFVAARRGADGQPEIHDWLVGERRSLIDALKDFLRSAIERGERVCGWNLAFDIAWLLALDDDELTALVFKVKWLDGMLLWKHATIEPEYDMDRGKRKSYSLKAAVAARWPEHGGYEEDVDYHATDPENLAKLRGYNIKDTVFSLALVRHWWGQLTERQQRCALIESDALPMLAQANLEGMVIDTLAVRELEQHLTNVAALKLEILEPHGVTEKVVRSPMQLGALLYDQWKLPVLKTNTGKKTGKVTRATDKEVLHELSFVDPRAKHLREYREALNNRTKFATGILTSVAYNEDGRTHPLAIPFGTYTGRLTYASKQGRNKDERPIGFPLHQEKRHPMYRGAVNAPEGYTLMEFDASGQEYRWMAILSGDEAMLRLCLPGEDAHAYMGAAIASQDYRTLQAAAKVKGSPEADLRQMGKVGNLSCQYRVSARKLLVVARVQYDMPLTLPSAQHIHGTYRIVYPDVVTYWAKQVHRAKRQGYVETLAGRRVQLTGSWDREVEWQMGSTAINYPVQGTGGDQKYLALSVLRPYLRSIGARFAWDLHDGIYFYVPNDKVKKAALTIKALLDNLPYEKAWGFKPPIPLPWDCKVGHSWGTLRDFAE
jgi:DNA polymerase I-like protein with 3'-5' exonuclease and polymerase domains